MNALCSSYFLRNENRQFISQSKMYAYWIIKGVYVIQFLLTALSRYGLKKVYILIVSIKNCSE